MEADNLNKKNITGRKKSVGTANKKRVKYSLLTFVLFLCIIELIMSNIQNIRKSINFSGKIKGLETRRNEELDRNKQLKSEIENYNSDTTLESIARNNLKMAGQNEILVIINQPREEEPADNKKDKSKKKSKEKKEVI